MTAERSKTEVKDFDDFVSQEIIKLKAEIANIKNKFNISSNLKIEEVTKAFDLIVSNFNKSSKLYTKKLSNCRKNIETIKMNMNSNFNFIVSTIQYICI